MCLAVPAKLVSLNGAHAVVSLHGNQVPVSALLVPDAVVGDWVLVHAGFAIQRLEAEAARRSWAVLTDLETRLAQAEPTKEHDEDPAL